MARSYQRPALVNLSLRAVGDSLPLTLAVSRLTSRYSIPVFVAAGNDASNACASIPANATGAIAVAASAQDDAAWADSNWSVGGALILRGPGLSQPGKKRGGSNRGTYPAQLCGRLPANARGACLAVSHGARVVGAPPLIRSPSPQDAELHPPYKLRCRLSARPPMHPRPAVERAPCPTPADQGSMCRPVCAGREHPVRQLDI